jgi:ketosteroid isomerase-like protein
VFAVVSSSYTEVSVSAGKATLREKSCATSVSGFFDWIGNMLSGDSGDDLSPSSRKDVSSPLGNQGSDLDSEDVDITNSNQMYINGNNNGSVHDFNANGGIDSNQRRGFVGEVVLPGSDTSPSRSNNYNSPGYDRPNNYDNVYNNIHTPPSPHDPVNDDMAMVEAIGVLNTYYDALNQQDLFAAVSVLADDVFVSFPEESRNWSGSSTAVSKFRHMFNTLPGFQGSLQILNCQVEVDRSVTIFAHCHFQCVQTRYSAEREMVYCVKAGKIFLIEHRA